MVLRSLNPRRHAFARHEPLRAALEHRRKHVEYSGFLAPSEVAIIMIVADPLFGQDDGVAFGVEPGFEAEAAVIGSGLDQRAAKRGG